MKILFYGLVVLFAVMCFTTSYAAPVYKAKTADESVTSEDQVQVEVTEDVTVKAVYTLSYLRTALATNNAKIAQLQAENAKIQDLIDGVEPEAKKVNLKKEVVPEPPVVIEN
jgi:TolA-binding protein